MECCGQDDFGHIMKLFDSNTCKNNNGKFVRVGKEIHLNSKSAYVAEFTGKEFFKITFVAKAILGNKALSAKIIDSKGGVVFHETISLSRTNKEISFDVNSNCPGLYKLVVESEKNNSKHIISRIIIVDRKKAFSKHDKKNLTLSAYNYDYTKALNAKVGIVVPYSIHGGAEIYLKNIIEEIHPSNIEFEILYLSKNSPSLSGKYREIFAGSLNRLKNQIILNNYTHVIYYNSLSVYRLLSSLKEEGKVSSKIIEIYHSDFRWSDAVSQIKDRKNIDVLIRVSESLSNDISGVKNIKTIPVGIDLDRFSNFYKKPLKLKNNIKDNRPIIGIVARMSSEKNIDYALSIAKNMKDFLFLFLGKGPMLSSYVKNNDSDNVIFLGHKNNIEEYHSIFDALLLTSKIEGTPISILESMASERVVFSTNVGAISDIISDGNNGFFITGELSKDVDIIRDNYNNRNIAKNARNSVADHDLRIVTKKFLDILFDKYEYLPNLDPQAMGEFI